MDRVVAKNVVNAANRELGGAVGLWTFSQKEIEAELTPFSSSITLPNWLCVMRRAGQCSSRRGRRRWASTPSQSVGDCTVIRSPPSGYVKFTVNQ